MMQRCFLVLIWWIQAAQSSPCAHRYYGNDHTVCVCNSTYCDSIPEYDFSSASSYIRFTSDKAGQRFEKSEGFFSYETTPECSTRLFIHSTNLYQTIQGFGGAFTDSAVMNIKSLSKDAQENLLSAYFSMKGSRYNLGRVPIGGTDFSSRKYTYCDNAVEKTSKLNFSLTEEEYEGKIPLLQKALELNPELRLIAASWTAPPWMKTNNDYVNGSLKEEYYQMYTDYLLTFLEEYRDQGLGMWAISTGNEPITEYLKYVRINSMSWTPAAMATWVSRNLGPTLSKSRHNQTLIFGLDDNRGHLTSFYEEFLSYESCTNYITGTAIHWYQDDTTSASLLDQTHYKFPEKLLVLTEASILPDSTKSKKPVSLGSWNRGERYMLNIIENLEHWVAGWLDWNLVLNQDGGPSWARNYVDASIIVNPVADEFYKQPMFYAIAHFSSFIPRNSVRIEVSQYNKSTGIKSVAFLTPDNEIVVVISNTSTKEQQVTIYDLHKGHISVRLEAKSFHTLIYKQLLCY
ncbi:lysosomal acid glucosylceramidase-like [Neodiprion fabricii]|uniref:lysosomal acid glucosylceramidase-like n=1 Tax=Neodiprion fabricii TaxID=2872261 RepID=UPI001ED975C8|nr:lysosomal acid glucosylceramidase-like [Neodiprion fabricii]